jgi:hypothetical protein
MVSGSGRELKERGTCTFSHLHDIACGTRNLALPWLRSPLGHGDKAPVGRRMLSRDGLFSPGSLPSCLLGSAVDGSKRR